jgi:hypothetical protein
MPPGLRKETAPGLSSGAVMANKFHGVTSKENAGLASRVPNLAKDLVLL